MSLSSVLRPPRLVILALSTLMAGACGDELSDADFGGVDLSLFFFDAGGTPVSYKTLEGFHDDRPATYYDFGWAAASQDFADEETAKRLGFEKEDKLKIPKVAPVNPMYFFFDSQGNPMFSTPQLEQKTGYYYMVGGEGVRTINPRVGADKRVAYPNRERDLLVDPNRSVADYQRPIIDVVMDRNKPELEQRYSGVWEFVEVTAPSGYRPDAIKSWATLEKGQGTGSGDFKIQRTGHIINCPIVDSRSLVWPSIASVYVPKAGAKEERREARAPQPRIELWHRNKRVFCFLANGWQTLGKTDPGVNGADTYTLFKAKAERISTMDVEVFRTGTAGTSSEKVDVVAPLGQLFIPAIPSHDPDKFDPAYLPYYVTTGALPRNTSADPPGYRPIRWWWTIQVTDAGKELTERSFRESGMRDVRQVDGSLLKPREGAHVRNFPLVGTQIDCLGVTSAENDPCRAVGLICSTLQGTVNPVCVVREKGYGDYCAPTIATCHEKLVAEGQGQDNVEDWLRTGKPLTAANAQVVSKEWQDYRRANRKIFDLPKDEKMYKCLQEPASGIGHCQLACNGGVANTLQGQVSQKYEVLTKGEKLIEVTYKLDSRCGGKLMPGYRCLPVTNLEDETGGAYCVRDCDSSQGEDFSEAACQNATPGYLSEKKPAQDLSKNTKCLESTYENPENGVITKFAGCRKDLSFSPYEDDVP